MAQGSETRRGILGSTPKMWSAEQNFRGKRPIIWNPRARTGRNEQTGLENLRSPLEVYELGDLALEPAHCLRKQQESGEPRLPRAAFQSRCHLLSRPGTKRSSRTQAPAPESGAFSREKQAIIIAIKAELRMPLASHGQRSKSRPRSGFSAQMARP